MRLDKLTIKAQDAVQDAQHIADENGDIVFEHAGMAAAI